MPITHTQEYSTTHRDTPHTPEEMQKYNALLIKHVQNTITYQKILQSIRGASVLDIERVHTTEENTAQCSDVLVCFFSYFDTYRMNEKYNGSISIDGKEYKIQISTYKMSTEERNRHYITHAAGGTRNVMLSNLEDYMKEEFLREEAEKAGEIESLRHFRDKKVAYVEYYSYLSAVKFARGLYRDSLFENVKVSFGKDKCGVEETADGAIAPNNRTVYFGNIAADTTAMDILDKVQGGQLFGIKMISDKKCAFVTFIDYMSAAAFAEYGNAFSIAVNSMCARIGRGKIQPLPAIVPILVYEGVTRIVSMKLDGTVPESKVQIEMGRHAEIVKTEKEGKNMLLTYLNMVDAYTACKEIRKNNIVISRLINGYAKDPCSNVSATELIMQVQRKELEME